MTEDLVFNGFPKAGTKFLHRLQSNNNRPWFKDHKSEYEQFVKAPAQAFMQEMIEGLNFITDEQLQGKMFRIYRDVRFAKDKTPYNTHVHMSFSNKNSTKQPKAGFYFAWELDHYVTGLGAFDMQGDALNRYRNAVDNPDKGAELQQILDNLHQQANMRMRDPVLKKVPNMYGKEHPRGELLRRKSLTVWIDTFQMSIGESSSAVDVFAEQFATLMPVYDWLNNI